MRWPPRHPRGAAVGTSYGLSSSPALNGAARFRATPAAMTLGLPREPLVYPHRLVLLLVRETIARQRAGGVARPKLLD